MEITVAVILSYISNYLLSFVIGLLGAFTSEIMTAMRNKTKINITRVFAPSFFDSFFICAIQSYLHVDFAIYAFICFLIGMWGLHIVETITNKKFIFGFFKSVLKSSSSALAKAANEGLEECDNKEETNNNEQEESE